MTCTRCDGRGFLNLEQAPEEVSELDSHDILKWLLSDEGKATDVTVCDCCGDGETWYGTPGQHHQDDFNGGIAECW